MATLGAIEQEVLDAMVARRPDLEKCAAALISLYEALAAAYDGDGKLIVCGNGGSHADAVPTDDNERTDGEIINDLHLAAMNHGVFASPRGMLALSTALDDALIDETADRLSAALGDVADTLDD